MSLNHIGLTVIDIDKVRDFYVAALKPLGYKITMNFMEGKVLGFGARCGPDFWLASVDVPGAEVEGDQKPVPKAPTGRVHIAFGASNRKKVREFYEAAIAAGGKCNGPPGLRPQYFATYYGAYVLDPDGRNIEAVCMKPGFLAEPWGSLGWSAIGLTVGAVGGIFGKFMGWL